MSRNHKWPNDVTISFVEMKDVEQSRRMKKRRSSRWKMRMNRDSTANLLFKRRVNWKTKYKIQHLFCL